MLFSGMITVRRCKDCGVEFSRVIPTSCLFHPLLLCVGTLCSMRPLGTLVGLNWWRVLLAIWANVLMLVVVFGGVACIVKILRPLPHLCPKCGREMTRSGGSYDFSLVPAFQEILGTAIYAALLVGLRRLS